MNIQEAIVRLRQLGRSKHALQLIREVIEDLTSKAEEVQATLGHGHGKLQAAAGPLMTAIEQANALAAATQAALDNLTVVATELS
jgi:inner membrane protein involved in colicin E2 resistance